MFIVLIRRTWPGLHENILTPARLQALRTSGRCFSLMIWSPLTVRACRLSVVAVVKVPCISVVQKCLTDYYTKARMSSWCWNKALLSRDQRSSFSVFYGPLESRVWNPGYLTCGKRTILERINNVAFA